MTDDPTRCWQCHRILTHADPEADSYDTGNHCLACVRAVEAEFDYEQAILKRVPDSLLDGLPSDDQDAIRAAIGKPVRLVPAAEHTYPDGYPGGEDKIEITFRDNGGDIHTIWVEVDDLADPHTIRL